MLLDLNHGTSRFQKLRPWDRSHCRQAAFAPFHCRMLQCPVGRKACGKRGQSKLNWVCCTPVLYKPSNIFTMPAWQPMVLMHTQCLPTLIIWTNSDVAGITSDPLTAGSWSPSMNGNSFFSSTCPARILESWSQYVGFSPGGTLGYFLGGYVPPGTPNWHPVLKKIPLKLTPRSRNGPIFYTPL